MKSEGRTRFSDRGTTPSASDRQQFTGLLRRHNALVVLIHPSPLLPRLCKSFDSRSSVGWSPAADLLPYPDVLISVLISTLSDFKTWLDTAAINSATKTTFWKIFSAIPTRGAFSKKATADLSGEFAAMINELSGVLFQAEESKDKNSKKTSNSSEAKLGTKVETPVGSPIKASFYEARSDSPEQRQARWTVALQWYRV
jgi:hypothetical protein